MRNSLAYLRRLAAAARLQCAGSSRYLRLRQKRAAERARASALSTPTARAPSLVDVRLASLDLALRRKGWFAVARDRE